MDTWNGLQSSKLENETALKIGRTGQERAQWLWSQLNPQPTRIEGPVAGGKQSLASRNEWATFLLLEGVERQIAFELAHQHKDIMRRLAAALDRLKKTNATYEPSFTIARSWSVDGIRLTSTVRPLHSSQSADAHTFAATIALDCLASRLRCCAKRGCRTFFIARHKKKYCSPRCSQSAAKQAYRTRKRKN